jgi:hypothetical protein
MRWAGELFSSVKHGAELADVRALWFTALRLGEKSLTEVALALIVKHADINVSG